MSSDPSLRTLASAEPHRVTLHEARSAADIRDRAREQPRRCGRACWRARLPTCCGGAASMPARSKAISLASPPLAAAPARRVRPARTVSADICYRAWRFCPGSCDPQSTPASARRHGLVDTGAQRGLNAKVEAAKIEAVSDAKIILLV